MGRPLNTDELTWLRSENARLQKLVGTSTNDNDKSESEIAGLYSRMTEKDQMIAQLNRQVDDLSEQVRKYQEQLGIK
jgi:predicted  nucleic acid-binding Zn-ribbon protein